MKKLIAIAIASIVLSGCAAKPPVPAAQLTDAQLCAELGHAQAWGNVNRVAEVMQEGKRRVNNNSITVDEATCNTLAATGANAVAQEKEEAARQQAAWAAIGQMGQQMQANALAQQQIDNQNMQAMQQTQALNNIAGAIRGY